MVFASPTSPGGVGRAFNFALTPAMDKIVWYEPQDGKEMINPPYKAYFAVF